MPGLYLHCVICGRKQADGLISGTAWGRLELPADEATHGAVTNGVVRVCPSCVTANADWQERALREAS